MNRATLRRPCVVLGCPDGEIGHAIPVKIPDVRHGTAEQVVVRECRPAIEAAGDLRAGLDRSTGVQEQEMDRPAICPPGIVRGRPNGEVGQAISVKVPDVRHGTAEKVVVRERRPAIEAAGDLRARLDRPAGVQEQEIDRPAICASGVVAVCPDRKVGHAVSIKIPDVRHGTAEQVVVRERRPRH